MSLQSTIAIVMLALSTPALAGDASTDAEVRRSSVPPLRVATRLVVRPETNPTASFEAGVQVWRSPVFKLDVNVGYLPGRALGMTGPPRSMLSADLSADLVAELGPWLETGPSAGVAYRLFRQQWTAIDELFVPIAGWRLDASVLRARRWSLQLTTKTMLDLAKTELVRETAEVRRLLPAELQVGVRFNFGHGHPPSLEDALPDEEVP